MDLAMSATIVLGWIFGSIFIWWGRFTFRHNALPSSYGSSDNLPYSPAGKIIGCLQITGGAVMLLAIVPALLIEDEIFVMNMIYFGALVSTIGLIGGPAINLIHKLQQIPFWAKYYLYEPRKAKRKNKLSDEQLDYDNQMEDGEIFSDHYKEQSNYLNDVN